ncbi:CsbD family protein [Lactobacillus jensenii]|uniref:CsbD family protein n=1 Tax=Lactobacillus jensenii TaxID=109790 RepID=UPI000C7D7436|nr:CsbD family protein [Lactobacillus jensenii]MCF1828343.1 CsbD family protein [Lactobacillus jensenii]MCF1852074.1 CsbD family protein [Lactobacillus jensenii]MDK7324733.1 CsbD family protein [Lactobacillus jensenii]MDK8130796.1 CsbD family protein [Lactobacillus jensenii]MDX5079683.1 CsbD family protein [Lactobacillus jensenii]
MSDKLAGKAKEVEGKLTGDKAREAQGKAEGLLGKAKEKINDVKEDVIRVVLVKSF